MPTPPPSPYFDRVLAALALASPICLASRFDDGFAHCIEASVAGAEALKKRKIKARAVPCAIIGTKADGTGFAVGLSPREVFKSVEEGAVFEEWVQAQTFPDGVDVHAHMAIEAKFAGHRAIIDLTYGQLRQHGLAVSTQMIARLDKGWPYIDDGLGWTLGYVDSPDAKEILALAKDVGPGLALELDDCIELALHADCDYDRFHAMVRKAHPEVYLTAMRRILRFAEPVLTRG